MNSRQRILLALEGKEADRVPLTEIGIWPETLQRWRKEGLPEGVCPHDYFGLDKIEFFSFDTSIGFPERVLSEDGKFRVYTDGDGCTYKMFVDRPVSPLLIKSSVHDIGDWAALKRNLHPHMYRFDSFKKEIIFGQALQLSQPIRYQKCKSDDIFTVIAPLEPCWYYLRLLGEEEALATIALDPSFAATIIKEYNSFTIDMLKTIFAQGYRFDALWVFSDLCYKNGMLFSPDFYRNVLLPQQKRLFDLAKENGMKVIYHCDGYVADMLPLLLEAGIDCIQPLEARAGNDVRIYLNQYQELSCMGNINMDVFTTTKERIEAEVTEKILSAKNTRRYLFHSDHSVPDTISFDNFCFAIKTARAMATY